MSIKTIILGLTAAASFALPGTASAQSWGGYGHGYYGQPRYEHRGDRFDRRDRHRWEQRRRWAERERRREWRRARHHRDRFYDRGYYRY